MVARLEPGWIGWPVCLEISHFLEVSEKTFIGQPVLEADQNMKKMRIVILGGGFGGFYTAQHLDRLLAGRSDIEVVLVSR